VPYRHEVPRTKDTYVLSNIDELFNQLDEILATLNNILGSHYLKMLRADAEAF